jgi:alkaline phosphatase D
MTARRPFMAALAACAATAVIPRSRVLARRSELFTLGIASGEVASDGMVLWTRLAPRPFDPDGGMPPGHVEVTWQVAADERFRHMVQSGTALAIRGKAHSVHVEVDGLRPDHTYFYRFLAFGEASPVGRVQTLPEAGKRLGKLRFAVAGCQRYEDGFFAAYRHIAERDMAFVFHYGDYIYEAECYAGRTRSFALAEAFTLEDYRLRYALYKSDPNLQAAHAKCAFIHSYDDHEVVNNWSGDWYPQIGSLSEFTRRRAAALQAFYEHMPLRRRSRPSDGCMRMRRRFRIGDLVDLHVLDTRRFRTPTPCANDVVIGERCQGAYSSGAEMLGRNQEQRLFRGMARSNARWTVLAQQVPILDLVRRAQMGKDVRKLDSWDGYVQPRQRLLDFLAASGPANVVILSGDVHSAWAGYLKQDFTDHLSAPLATEFVAPSLTSRGVLESNLDRPAIYGANPHVTYFDQRRGYLECQVDRRRWSSVFRFVDDVGHQDSGCSDETRFVVTAGSGMMV